MYYGILYVGEQYHAMQVLIDTSSDWVILEGRECTNCAENKYDPNTSAYFSMINDRQVVRDYGNIINTKVVEVQDQVCLKFDDTCIQPFRWLMVVE